MTECPTTRLYELFVKTGTCQVLWEHLGAPSCLTRGVSAEVRLVGVAMKSTWISWTKQ